MKMRNCLLSLALASALVLGSTCGCSQGTAPPPTLVPTPTAKATPVILPTPSSTAMAAPPTLVPAPTAKATVVILPSPSPTAMAAPWTPGQLEIHLLDVQHGDAQLIISPTGETMLIDAGRVEYAPKVARYLRQVLGKVAVDYLLISHYHIDHISGVVPLLRDHGLKVHRAILDRSGDRNEWDSSYYREYHDYLADPARGLKRVRVYSGDTIDMGPEISVEVLAVCDIDNRTSCGVPLVGLNDNDNCIALWLTFDTFDYWTAGDLSGEDSSRTTDVESACSSLVPRTVDVYKADHHGIDWNSNANLMAALQPKVSLISLENLHSPAALWRMMEYGDVYATNRILALAKDRSPIFIEDSDDIVVICQDGITFGVEGKAYTARP